MIPLNTYLRYGTSMMNHLTSNDFPEIVELRDRGTLPYEVVLSLFKKLIIINMVDSSSVSKEIPNLTVN
jgi:hypothetical protein